MCYFKPATILFTQGFFLVKQETLNMKTCVCSIIYITHTADSQPFSP